MHEDQHDAEKESGIADAVHDERLLAGVAGALLLEVEADQQVRTEPHPFPSHKHQDEVVRQDQGQHGEHEEVEVGEEAIVAGVVPHVPGRVDVDQETDAGDDEDHDGRERIQLKAHRNLEGRETSTRRAAGGRRRARCNSSRQMTRGAPGQKPARLPRQRAGMKVPRR